MKYSAALYLIELAVALALLYAVASFVYHVSVSLALARHAVPFQHLSGDYGSTLLVLGDSTAVGVGANKPEDTVAGLLAAGLEATYTENHAVSGAVVADIPSQTAHLARTKYDAILLQIGANDIIDFKSAAVAAAELSPILDMLKTHSSTIYLMSAGNVGGATIFPYLLRPFYTSLNLKYHDAFAALAREKGITYVNLYTPQTEDPFSLHPEIYLASDGLHPSSAGYALFYERLTQVAGL